MPGLVGFYSKSLSRQKAVSAVEKMQEVINHKPFFKRDPIFSNNNFYASRSHIDVIQRSTQPASKGNVHIWLDGEFYNQEELSDHSNGNLTDPELLLELYNSDSNLKFLEKIDGGYSAVIYDERKNILHLITDRYCRQHLYWAQFKDGFAWSSEIKAFTELPSFNIEIDPLAVEEFLGIGNMLGERTWVKGIQLMPASSVMTVNLYDYSIELNRYWWWDQISPLNESLNTEVLAEETGELLVKAVKKHHKLIKNSVGITLSGGKDSRAILAAIPDSDKPIHAVTFGKKNSWDILNAARAAKIKNANHHIHQLSASNWFEEKLESIWWTDGQVNLTHLNSEVGINKERALFDNSFVGLGGEAISGRSHLYDTDKAEDYLNNNYLNKFIPRSLFDRIREYINRSGSAEIFYFDHRFRNFSVHGLKRGECSGIRTRVPLLDNKLMEFIYSVPYAYKESGRLYDQMLLMNYPEIFCDLDWTNTNLDVSAKQKAKYYWIKGKKRFMNLVAKSGFIEPITINFTDYNNWIRSNPASIFFQKVLQNEDAIFPEYIDRNEVINCLEEHFKGQDNTVMLCRYLTFEIWLQQILNGNLRTNQDYRNVVNGRC